MWLQAGTCQQKITLHAAGAWGQDDLINQSRATATNVARRGKIHHLSPPARPPLKALTVHQQTRHTLHAYPQLNRHYLASSPRATGQRIYQPNGRSSTGLASRVRIATCSKRGQATAISPGLYIMTETKRRLPAVTQNPNDGIVTDN